MEEATHEDVALDPTFEDYANRMTIQEAAERLGVAKEIIRGALERGEMSFIRFPGNSRKSVTPKFVADWISAYCVHKNTPLPG